MMNSANDTESAEASGTKKRGPYDGSYAHGVNPKDVKTILEYDKSLKRLKTRFTFLRDEFIAIGEKFNDSDDTSQRALLLKDKTSMESQIDTIKKVKNDLIALRSNIVEQEQKSQAAIQFVPPEFD